MARGSMLMKRLRVLWLQEGVVSWRLKAIELLIDILFDV
jgi:hypothetical protein